MRRNFILVSLILFNILLSTFAQSNKSVKNEEEVTGKYNEFKKSQNKNFTKEEETQKFQNFKKNVERAKQYKNKSRS